MWRLEQTKTGTDIVIDGWEEGIAESSTQGIADMRQVNLVSFPGVVQVGYPITNSTTSGGTLDIPCSRATQFSSGSAVAYFILDAAGQVYRSTSLTGTWTFLSSSNSTTNSSANDAVAYWKGYLFKFRAGSIDYMAGGAGSWTVGWNPADGTTTASATITANSNHYAITPINDKLYFGNGNGVGSISEVGTFDPTNTATYVFAGSPTQPNAFQLPANDFVQSLAALGAGTSNSTITILVGGSQNAIYPFLTSGTSFQTPIFIGDNFIANMVSVNQSVFIFSGATWKTGAKSGRGRIYITNSVQAQEFFKIPDSITGFNDPYFQWGDAMFHRNSLIFGFDAVTNAGANMIGMADVWALDLDTKAFRSVSLLVTNAGYANATALIPDQSGNLVSGYSYIVGYSDGTNGASRNIGRSSTNAGIGTSVIKTDQIPVGTFFDKYTFNQVEVKLQTPLQSGESVVVSGFSDTSGAGSTITINTVGAISGQGAATFEKSQWISFQLSTTGNSQSSGARVKEIRIHGQPILA